MRPAGGNMLVFTMLALGLMALATLHCTNYGNNDKEAYGSNQLKPVRPDSEEAFESIEDSDTPVALLQRRKMQQAGNSAVISCVRQGGRRVCRRGKRFGLQPPKRVGFCRTKTFFSQRTVVRRNRFGRVISRRTTRRVIRKEEVCRVRPGVINQCRPDPTRSGQFVCPSKFRPIPKTPTTPIVPLPPVPVVPLQPVAPLLPPSLAPALAPLTPLPTDLLAPESSPADMAPGPISGA